MKSSGVRGASAVSEVERRIADLVAGLSVGRPPAYKEVARLEADLKTLSESDGRVQEGKIAEFEDAIRVLVAHAVPPRPLVPFAVPGQRQPGKAKAAVQVAAASSELDARFDRLRTRVDALRDAMEAGRWPTLKVLDEVQVDLAAFRQVADGPKIRQMIDDIAAIRRRVDVAARSSARARMTSCRLGPVFWDRPGSKPVRPAPKRRRSTARCAEPAGPSPEQVRLVEQSRDLRERADLFAAAVPHGRTLPQRESARLFQDFRLLRPRLDGQTQALNDAAVLRLTEAVDKVRRRATG